MRYRGIMAIATTVAAATIMPADAAVQDPVSATGRLETLCSCHGTGVELGRVPPLAGSSCSVDKLLLVIDRFEGKYAVLEYDGQMINLPRQLLPSTAQEGDVLCFSLCVDREETEHRRQSIKILSDGLFE